MNHKLIIFIIIVLAGLCAAIYLLILNPYSLVLYGDANSRLVQTKMLSEFTRHSQIIYEIFWLPLPYLLLLPFVKIDLLYNTGLASTIPNIILLAFSIIYLYKTLLLIFKDEKTALALSLTFGLNPNVLYLSLSAMTEAPALFFYFSIIYYFLKILNSTDYKDTRQLLYKSTILIILGSLTRYELWIVVLSFSIIIFLKIIISGYNIKGKVKLTSILFISYAGILLWLAWNKIVFGDIIYFSKAVFFSSSWQAKFSPSGSPVKHDIFKSILIYSQGLSSIFYSPVVLLSLISIFVFVAGLFKRKQVYIKYLRGNYLLCLFLFIVPVFTLFSIYTGSIEMSYYGMNHRYTIFFAPLILISLGLLSYEINYAFKGKIKKYSLLIIISYSIAILIFYIDCMCEPSKKIETYYEAGAGFYNPIHKASMETSTFLKKVKDGKILLLTGSGMGQRIVKFSGLEINDFDIPYWGNSLYTNISYVESNFNIVVLAKEPIRDGITWNNYWFKNLDKLYIKYDMVYNNKFYFVFSKKN